MSLSIRQNIQRRAWVLFFVFLLVTSVGTAQSASPIIEVPNPPNLAAQQAKHYVVLVSLDGFRYDYAAKYGAKNLQAMAQRGASAPEGMIPPYPSVTFASHYTIVTGLYPEHTGIVANSFYDPGRRERFSYTDPNSSRDGSWYGGTPLWVLAEKQGMRSASFFWPGSEAEIQGKRPSYYLKFDDKFPDEKRVQQVIEWLRLPPEQRPHFITLYYSNADHAGHTYGPGAPETGQAVRHVDEMIGRLVDGIAQTGLPVDLVVLADHGMEAVQGGLITLDKWTDLSQCKTSGSLIYAESEADAEKVYESLLGVSDVFKIYRRANVPAYLHFNSNPREGDPVVVPTGPYLIVARAPSAASQARALPRGQHGYDPRTMPSMKAIFYATGPDVRVGVKVAPFESVNIYPFIAQILGLGTDKVDGNLRILRGILKMNSQN